MKAEEILEKSGKDYKPLSDKIRLTIDKISENETELNMTFSIEAKTILNDILYLDPDDLDIFYGLHSEKLLSLIEENLYNILPAFNIAPKTSLSGTNVKIRIDSHIENDMILVSPKTYAEHFSLLQALIHRIE